MSTTFKTYKTKLWPRLQAIPIDLQTQDNLEID